MKTFRTPFLILLAVNVSLLAAVGGWWWWTHRVHVAAAPTNDMAGMAMPNAAAPTASAPPAAPAHNPLAPIQLSPQRLQSIGVETGVVERRNVHDDIRTVGNVAVDEQGQAYVQTRFSGWIHQVFANTGYQLVQQGQPLFSIYSPDLVTTEHEYLLARQNQRLLASSPVPGVASGAAALVQASLARLRQWNVPQREIDRLRRTGKVEQYLEVDSPASGYITERNALPNMYVQPATRLYTVADLSTVWVEAQVFQDDLGRVHVGDAATLSVDAYPGRTFRGRVDFVYPDVNLKTRTARVRLVFANPGLRLTPGMFVNVDLEVPMGEQLVVPAPAVFQTGTRQIAFLDRGQGYLQPTPVVAGAQIGNNLIILKGLRAGERVVTSANFLIDSESQLQAAVGAFAPPPPAAAATGAPAAAAAQISLTTLPDPPLKGPNTFQVKLTGPNGQGIADAQVQVVFYMPAMPAMGMSAQRAAFTLTGKGGGLYAAQGDLPVGGSWQVSVTARRGGQVLAGRQLSLSVGGGM